MDWCLAFLHESISEVLPLTSGSTESQHLRCIEIGEAVFFQSQHIIFSPQRNAIVIQMICNAVASDRPVKTTPKSECHHRSPNDIKNTTHKKIPGPLK